MFKGNCKTQTKTQTPLHLHSFIKEKYNHTRSTHCSAMLNIETVDNENEPPHANGSKETLEDKCTN